MAEASLQVLIDRLKREAVDDARTEAERILGAARTKAQAELDQANQQAKAIVAAAQRDAEAHAERATRTLEQAARDLLIHVGRGIEQIFAGLVDDAVGHALDADGVQQMLVKMAEAYVQRGVRDRQVHVLLATAERDQFVAFLKGKLRSLMGDGIEVHLERQLGKGFRVQLANQQVYHDFSQQAIAEALTSLVRPELAAIVRRVAVERGDVTRSRS